MNIAPSSDFVRGQITQAADTVFLLLKHLNSCKDSETEGCGAALDVSIDEFLRFIGNTTNDRSFTRSQGVELARLVAFLTHGYIPEV